MNFLTIFEIQIFENHYLIACEIFGATSQDLSAWVPKCA